jgi:hypothetical protein
MKRYQGRRTPEGCVVTVREEGAEPRPLDPRLDLRCHSPTGNGEFAIMSTRSRFPSYPTKFSSVSLP